MKKALIAGILCIISAILLFVLTQGAYARDQSMKKNGLSAQAVITQIDEESYVDHADDSLNFNYTVYVDYLSQDGVLHSNIDLGFFRDGMKEGDAVKIYYMPQDPQSISCAELSDNPSFYLYLFAAAGILCIVGLVFIAKSIFPKSSRESA
ncbi:MAG: DUF3592 domain-containing protein [Eubacteriales bacterium]|nr:DUF3592 domain-containing protein [Eubacteriales bacterium]